MNTLKQDQAVNCGSLSFGSLNFGSLKQEISLEVKMAWREPSFVLPTLLFPIMFYLFFGIVFSDLAGSVNSATYLMVSYGVFGIISPALFGFGAAVALERDKGWLTLKQVSPASPLIYILAKLINALIFAVVVIIALFWLGAVFGNVLLTTNQWLSLAGLLLLGTLPFCALGLAIGLWVKGNAAIALLNLIFLPSAFLSGLAIPIMMFPDYLQSIAQVLPPYHLSQLGLKIVELDLGQSTVVHITVLVITTIIFSALAIAGYQRSLTKS